MPRTGGVYTPPAGTKGVPNTTIQSSRYNALVDDLTADANAARPITAGGTGATTATQARQNLGALAEADIVAAAAKETPVDADGFMITDSAAAGAFKRVLWSRIKAVLKAYFDTIYRTSEQVNTAISTAIGGLTKDSVGLGNVDNTSDADKPVSTAVATALATKATLGANVTFGTIAAQDTTLDGRALELAYGRTNSGPSFIDFHTTPGSDYDVRLLATGARLELTAGTFASLANVAVTNASPFYEITRQNIGTWRMHVNANNEWGLYDPNNSARHIFRSNGTIWTVAYGDLNTRIENAAEGWANNKVSQIYMRRTGQGDIALPGDRVATVTPGNVMIGVRANGSGGQITHIIQSTMQIYDPVNGWRNMG